MSAKKPQPVECSACDAIEESGQHTTKHTHIGTDRRGRAIKPGDIDVRHHPKMASVVRSVTEQARREWSSRRCDGFGQSKPCGACYATENITAEAHSTEYKVRVSVPCARAPHCSAVMMADVDVSQAFAMNAPRYWVLSLNEACKHIRDIVRALDEQGVEVGLGSGAMAVREDSFYIAFKCSKCRMSYER